MWKAEVIPLDHRRVTLFRKRVNRKPALSVKVNQEAVDMFKNIVAEIVYKRERERDAAGGSHTVPRHRFAPA